MANVGHSRVKASSFHSESCVKIFGVGYCQSTRIKGNQSMAHCPNCDVTPAKPCCLWLSASGDLFCACLSSTGISIGARLLCKRIHKVIHVQATSSDSSNASAGEADTDESIITTKALHRWHKACPHKWQPVSVVQLCIVPLVLSQSAPRPFVLSQSASRRASFRSQCLQNGKRLRVPAIERLRLTHAAQHTMKYTGSMQRNAAVGQGQCIYKSTSK